MKRLSIAISLLLLPAPMLAQAPTRAELDSAVVLFTGARAVAVSSRGFIRGSETQLTKVITQQDSALAFLARLIARMDSVVAPQPDTVIPPTPDTVVVPPPDTTPALPNVQGLQSMLAKMDNDQIGVHFWWTAAAGVSAYEYRVFYLGEDPSWLSTTRNEANAVLQRLPGQTYKTCVRVPNVLAETCVSAVAPDIETITLVLDSTAATAGSKVTACAYAWYQGRVVTGTTATFTSSDPAVATVEPDTTAATATYCLSKIPADKVWKKP